MLINKLIYFTISGLIGIAGTPDDPYYNQRGWSDLGKQLRASGRLGLEWINSNGKIIKREFESNVQATIDPSSKYIVAVVYGDSKYPNLKNAVVFNADGTILRTMKPPKFIDTKVLDNQMKKYTPDNFEQVRIKDGKVTIGINFNFDWYQIRVYDIENDQWGPIVSTARY